MELVIIDNPGISNEGLIRSTTDSKKFKTKRTFYDFTTENLAHTVKVLSEEYPEQLKGDILVVNGSGDHALNLVQAQPNSITSLDQSLVACLYSDLKIIARQHLPYKEFLGFFSLGFRQPDNGYKIDNELSFSPKIYARLRPHLHPMTVDFFDRIINDPDLIRLHMISKSGNINNAHKNNNYLRCRKIYDETNIQLPEITHVVDTIEHHLETTDKKYDILHLSNMTGYIPLDEFRELRDSAREKVASKGIVILYMYGGCMHEMYPEIFKQPVDGFWDYNPHKIPSYGSILFTPSCASVNVLQNAR